MGTRETILIAVLTSGTTVGLLVKVLETWIANRIKLENEIKLTKLKAELEQQNETRLAKLKAELERQQAEQLVRLKAEQDRISSETNELFKVRLQIFPKLSALIYRIRNAVRESRDNPPRDSGSLEALSTLIKDFEACTYEFRFPLEQVQVFSSVHQYKRHLQTFLLNAKELASWFHDGGDKEEEEGLRRDLDDLYKEIDQLHQHIIDELLVLLVSRANTSEP